MDLADSVHKKKNLIVDVIVIEMNKNLIGKRTHFHWKFYMENNTYENIFIRL